MKIKKISMMILILSLIFVAISGCTSESQPPAKPPVPVKEVISATNGTIGTITYDSNKNLISFLVEGAPGTNPEIHYYDKAIVSKTGVTKAYIGDSEEEFPVNDLKEGMNVEVIYYGTISNSYPIKATARSIRIIE